MRAAFVNPGGPAVPDLVKARSYGITRLYWEARDPAINAGLFLAIRERGFEVGIMRDPNWSHATAIDLARELDDNLIRLGANSLQCAVLVDYEGHEESYMRAFVREWRDLRPNRVTGWTLEPYQGGWFSKDLCIALSNAGISVYPQTYYGNMAPAPIDEVRCQLINAGLPRGLVSPVYDAAHIPRWWDGIAFPFHALP